MREWLNGNKTYLCMIVLGGLGLGKAWIDADAAQAIWNAILALGGAALRHGIAKAEKAANGNP